MGPLFINQSVRRRGKSSGSGSASGSSGIEIETGGSSGSGSGSGGLEGDNDNDNRLNKDLKDFKAFNSKHSDSTSSSPNPNGKIKLSNVNNATTTNLNHEPTQTPKKSRALSEDFSNLNGSPNGITVTSSRFRFLQNHNPTKPVAKGTMNPGQSFLNPNPNLGHQNRNHRPNDSNSHIYTPLGCANFNGKFIPNNNEDKDNDIKHCVGTNVNANSKPLISKTNGLRKYLVLLQDCLAIKFVPAGQQFGFNDNETGLPSNNGADGQLGSSEVDHSLHGLYLYKGFREANLKCYWNATLCEAVRQLEYKGYIVPSTILVFALPRFLSVLRTAWSRKMLRNPPGHRLDFVGEIEEIIAEPIAQGQFAPLSDSLCWAILELTSSGQEAFVDSILYQLATAFPLMSLPPRELIYQTLEKLIKDRKIYQTSHGYFVVTPDTFRYMNSGGESNPNQSQYFGQSPLDALMSSFYDADKVSQHSLDWDRDTSGSGDGDDFLILSQGNYNSLNRIKNSPLKRHNSLRVIRQRDLDLLLPSMGARSLSFRLSKTKSLFESHKGLDLDRPCSSTKSNRSSTLDSNSRSDSNSNGSTASGSNSNDSKNSKEDKKAKVQKGKENKDKNGKKPSFFKRWFSFRRSTTNSKNSVKTQVPPPLEKAKSAKSQKDTLIESLTRSPKIYSSISSKNRQSYPTFNSFNTNPTSAQQPQQQCRSYEDILDIDHSYSQHLGQNPHPPPPCHYMRNGKSLSRNVPMSKWNSLPSGSRRSKSRRSILEDSPFYDVLNYNKATANSTNTTQIQRDLFTMGMGSVGHGLGSVGSRASSVGYGIDTGIPVESGNYTKRPHSVHIPNFQHVQNFQNLHNFQNPHINMKSMEPQNQYKRRSISRLDHVSRIDSPCPSTSVSAIYASIGQDQGHHPAPTNSNFNSTAT